MDAKFYIKNLANSSKQNIEDAGEIEITQPGIIEAQEGYGFTKIDTTSLIEDAGELDIYDLNIVIPEGKGYSKINIKLNKLPENADVVIYMKRTSDIEDIELDEDIVIKFYIPCELYLIKDHGVYLNTPTRLSSFQEFFELVHGLNAFLVYGSIYEYENINQIKDLPALTLISFDQGNIIEAYSQYFNLNFRFDSQSGTDYASGNIGYDGI